MTRRGLLGLEFWHNGMKQMSANKPLNLPTDAAGLKFRVQPSDVIWRTDGSDWRSPQPMAFSEVYGALQTGVVDGQENTWSNIYGQKFFEVQDGVTETNHGIIDYHGRCSGGLVGSLDARLRDQLATILQRSHAAERNALLASGRRARQSILDAGGNNPRADASERQAWVDAMMPVWAQFEDDVGQENIDAAQAINAHVSCAFDVKTQARAKRWAARYLCIYQGSDMTMAQAIRQRDRWAVCVTNWKKPSSRFYLGMMTLADICQRCFALRL